MKPISLMLTGVLALAQLNQGQKPPVRCEDTGPSGDAVTEEIKKIDHEIDEASVRGDATAIQQRLADEMIAVSPYGSITRRAEVLENTRPPRAGTKMSIVAADIQVLSFGDTAVITSNKTQKWEWSSGSSSDQYRETNTYVRKNGRWLLITSQTSHEPPPYSAKDVQLNLSIDETRIGGNRNAAVVLIEFADYQCPYCRDFAAKTMKQIERDYIDTGRIGFVFHDLPLVASHQYALKASVAAQCAAAQGKLWEMNHKLLADPMALAPADLMAGAQSLNLDMTKFRQCFDDDRSTAAVQQSVREASSLGIDGTPMFLVGVRKPGTSTIKALRMIEGGYPYEIFKATLETLIAARE